MPPAGVAAQACVKEVSSMDKLFERLTSLPGRWQGAIIGLATGLLWAIVGFWWLVLIFLLAATGYFVGMWREGDDNFGDFIRRLGPAR